MSSMSSVAGLSKYIQTLPRTRYSAMAICILSFLTGVIYCLYSELYQKIETTKLKEIFGL